MNLREGKTEVLAMIEELNPESEYLTDDPDIQAKINGTFNRVLYEMARYKKIPRYIEMEVEKGELIDFARLEKECGSEVYQINIVRGVDCDLKAQGTIIKAHEKGTAEIEIFIYPERITSKTNDNYEFELSPDALEVMMYGVAGDLLKSDISSDYGVIYSKRYEEMKQMLDSRYAMGSITIESGVEI
jgi:hypothetical protein